MQIYTLRNSIEQPSRETCILSCFPLISSPPHVDLGGTLAVIIHVRFRVKIETMWFSEIFFF